MKLLKELGCPNVDNLRGQDLDWLWDTKASHFLEWACKNLNSDNCLTDKELGKWSKIPKDSVLTGPRLEEALKHLDEAEGGGVVNQDETEDLDAVREELETREASNDELVRLKSNLSNQQARLSLMLNDLEAKLEAGETKLSDEQKRLLRLSADSNEAIDRLVVSVKEVMASTKCGTNKPISETDLSAVVKEDESVRAKIRALVHRRFGKFCDDREHDATGNNDDDECSAVRGRDVQEFEDLVDEIDRIRFSLQDSEKKRILKEAQCQGARASLDELKMQVKTSLQDSKGSSTADNTRIEAESKEVEESIMGLQRDITSMSKDVLPSALEKKVAALCSKILSVDLQAKIDRQKFVASQLEVMLDLLLELTSGQEVLGGAMQLEADALDALECQLAECDRVHKATSEDHARLSKLSQESVDLEQRNQRKTLMAWDKALLSLHKLMSGKGKKTFAIKYQIVLHGYFLGLDLDPSMITYDDLNKLMQKFIQDNAKAKVKLDQKNLEWQVERDKIRKQLNRLQRDLQMGIFTVHFTIFRTNYGMDIFSDSPSGYCLTPAELSAKMKQAQNESKIAEASVKEAVSDWERNRRGLKDNPVLGMEKKIWRDFLNQPEVMAQNITSMK